MDEVYIKIKCLVCDEEFETKATYVDTIICPKCGAWTRDLESWFCC